MTRVFNGTIYTRRYVMIRMLLKIGDNGIQLYSDKHTHMNFIAK
jgi:hypothetical protein